jgi:uncharacterized protein
MSVETVDAVVRRLREDGLLQGSLLVSWHAGEPLVLPPDFYDERIDRFDVVVRDGVRVTHAIQTNATLLTDEYCDLFISRGINVGVSIDGPAFIHDAQRVTRGGKPTHHLALRGIRRLQERGIPFNVICLLTDLSVRHPDAIYEFFRANEIRAIGFNIEELEGANRTSSITEAGFEHRYLAFLRRFWTLTKQDGDRMRVREFEDGEKRILDPAPRRNGQTDPFVYVSVAWNGDFSTFSPELLGTSAPGFDTFTLGNVFRAGFKRALETQLAQRLWGDIQTGVEACRTGCAYFDVCGGGNPSNKIAENGSFTSTETRYCRARIKVTSDFLLDVIERRRISEPALA